MKIKNEQKNNSRGFVLLFAIVLSSIILSVALGVANIALKEVGFSASAKNTNDAFYAADTGAECALYYDIVGVSTLTGKVNPFGQASGNVVTTCAGTSVNLGNGAGTLASPWVFYIYPLGVTKTACAIVSLYRDTSVVPNVTNIVSKGYNVYDSSSTVCASTNPNRVERKIQIIY